MTTISDYTALIRAASAALSADNPAGALTHALAAQALLAAIPDTEKDGRSIKFREREIAELVKSIRAAEAATRTVQVSKITRVVVSD
jgi:hypothetical protein